MDNRKKSLPLLRTNEKEELIMDLIIKDKVEYIIVLIAEFARIHGLSDRQAFRYLERFKAIDFIDKHYEIAHTLSFETVVEDLAVYCRRQGGAIV